MYKVDRKYVIHMKHSTQMLSAVCARSIIWFNHVVQYKYEHDTA